MYEHMKYLGKTYSEWAAELNGMWTPGELYRMTVDGIRIENLSRRPDLQDGK